MFNPYPKPAEYCIFKQPIPGTGLCWSECGETKRYGETVAEAGISMGMRICQNCNNTCEPRWNARVTSD